MLSELTKRLAYALVSSVNRLTATFVNMRVYKQGLNMRVCALQTK